MNSHLLKKKGGLEKLKGNVRFASLQYLIVKPIRRVDRVSESVTRQIEAADMLGYAPLRVVTQACVTVPAKAGSRTVCVHAVDVFGFEAEVMAEVAYP